MKILRRINVLLVWLAACNIACRIDVQVCGKMLDKTIKLQLTIWRNVTFCKSGTIGAFDQVDKVGLLSD